jgi:sugar/nucleoside kinase (ribokinase family)
MPTSKEIDILFVGNYTKDTIITPAGTRYVDGGAVNYAAHAAIRLGSKTAVITHLSKEDRRMVDGLEKAGIVTFPQYTASSTCITLDYPTTDPDIRKLSVVSVAEPITQEELKQVKAKTIVIGSTLRGEVTLDVIRAASASGAKVGLDVQGFVRVLRGIELKYEPWEEMKTILPYVDYLKSDAVEAEFLTGTSDLRSAAKFYADLGSKEIVLTHRDGMQILADGKFTDRTFHPETLIGRSGRGDTCLGSYAAARLQYSVERSASISAAVTSLKMEKPVPYDRSKAELDSYLAKWAPDETAG